jgi:hypothetical protein
MTDSYPAHPRACPAPQRSHRPLELWFLCLALILALPACAGDRRPLVQNPPSQKKALVLGRGDPIREPDGAPTHPQAAKDNFLRLMGNPKNDPAKGWTCDLSWDLMNRLGLDPARTTHEQLFDYIGRNKLGYRIVMQNFASGADLPFWSGAVSNGIMPFAPQGNNDPGKRFDDGRGLRTAVSVAGGVLFNSSSYGPSVEFIDALPSGDAAQSWANQVVAARFAKVLDAHPEFNIWDARQFLRQSASSWKTGWTEKNGFGRPNERADVGRLLPAPPLEFQAVKSRDGQQVSFGWRNFPQSDFAATVIARKDGRVIYDGDGTSFTWTSDVDGEETFTWWSRNRAGEKSRLESFQTRVIGGLRGGPLRRCLILGAAIPDQGQNLRLAEGFEKVATNWSAHVVWRPGNPAYDLRADFPAGPVVAVLPDYSAMIEFAITNNYRLVLVPVSSAEGDLYRYKADWDRAAAASILVVTPHHASLSASRKPQARRLSPPRLYSAITVGQGSTTNYLSFGPGLEFFDTPTAALSGFGLITQMDAAATLAGKLALLLDANPRYNAWDARQHLRQSASLYASGWVEDGGYGRPPALPARLTTLDPAPPLDIQAEKSADGKTVTLSWRNFAQSSFAETVIRRKDGRVIYNGTGTRLVWPSDVAGDETFSFFSKDKSGRFSRPELYTSISITGLMRP